jgi:hypothetical protein
LVLDYLQFKDCGAQVSRDVPRLAVFFEPSIFMCLQRDENGCIGINSLFDLIMRKMNLQQARLDLCLYDPAATGFIAEKDLEVRRDCAFYVVLSYIQAYVLDHIQSLPQLATLDDDFHSIYAVYATRKFMFMLDLHRTGRVRIQDLVCSEVMTEWLELQQQGDLIGKVRGFLAPN